MGAKESSPRNQHMTRHCRHGKQGVCDYDLIAFGDHELYKMGEPTPSNFKPGKYHLMEGQPFYCAACPPYTRGDLQCAVHGNLISPKDSEPCVYCVEDSTSGECGKPVKSQVCVLISGHRGSCTNIRGIATAHTTRPHRRTKPLGRLSR